MSGIFYAGNYSINVRYFPKGIFPSGNFLRVFSMQVIKLS